MSNLLELDEILFILRDYGIPCYIQFGEIRGETKLKRKFSLIRDWDQYQLTLQDRESGLYYSEKMVYTKNITELLTLLT